MIPSLLAQDVDSSLRDFIITGFETSTWPFAGKFQQLVDPDNKGGAFIKGPWLSIDLPFAGATDSKDFFRGFQTEHSPFVHQQKAWKNLITGGPEKNTIVATGTGSGKTECFLYPLLDHCQRNRARGIKAIVIYPMNALASDQAKRFAAIIHNTPELKGKIRTGLFVGDRGNQKFMDANQSITCKDTLREHPPDILLTNYKMLDFLLMRPKDQGLWEHNGPDLLKYLIVDELHTFDGAQGSDLAMLIRRLKARLHVKTENLICVGTSATLGGEDQKADLADYATDIFNTTFDANSIIGESRKSYDQFLAPAEYTLSDPSLSPEQFKADHYGSLQEYLTAQARLFFGDDCSLDPVNLQSRQQLGDRLRKHLLTHKLLAMARHGPVSFGDLRSVIRKHLPPQLAADGKHVLVSLLALLSHARGRRYPGELFVAVRVALWARELRRIVARVSTDDKQVLLQFADDLKSRTDNEKRGHIYLPVVQCTECHSTAWLTTVETGKAHIEQDFRLVYSRFFSSDKRTRVLLPLQNEGNQPAIKGIVKYLCSDCGHLQTRNEQGECESCKERKLVTVYEPDLNTSRRRGGIPTLESQRMCPVCQSSSSLILFGSRAASLGSVAIHQIFSNKTNDDKRLLAFSDSVQDAAHRAGFFAARTWQNNFRMALAKALVFFSNNQGKDLTLTDVFDYLPDYWLQEPANEQRLSSVEFITQFIAPNMQTLGDYLNLKENEELDDPDPLIDLIKKRLVWESLAEFGFASLKGRSLERVGVATVAWNPELMERTAGKLLDAARERLGATLEPREARYMLWGITLRMKRKGAIFHPLLGSYIRNGGARYLLSRNVLPFMPYFGGRSPMPRFPGELAEKGLERLLPGTQGTWYSRWVQQFVPAEQPVGGHFIPDLLQLLMGLLVESGLLLELETGKGNKVWALNPQNLFVTTDLHAMRLRRTDSGSRVATTSDDEQPGETEGAFGSWYFPASWVDCLTGMPSLDDMFKKDQSAAIYEPWEHTRQSMYRAFYMNGEIERVIAHEHTGLLQREYREELERRFMANPPHRKEWYENLLSATPTLELGVDIGSLSSVLLCSVPPSQANYVQRIGRGGRRDGNSFALTLANARPHDLYFYADPAKMLSGGVEAPAIFLNAPMVLRRQLLAFCFDKWGVRMGGNHVIPEQVQAVLDAVENRDSTRFPYTLLDFIGKQRDALWQGFDSLLVSGDSSVSADTRNSLKAWLLGTNDEDVPLHTYVLGRIEQVVKERRNLAQLQKDLQSELRKLKKKPQDQARDEREEDLGARLEGTKRLKTDLNKKNTFNFFTDEGLLPNYAFPEEGTTLRSVILRHQSKPAEAKTGRTKKYQSLTFEYSRPAYAALSELVPESVFYASNRKVKIERVEMARGENLENWRLCPGCDYSKQVDHGDDHAACPRCSDPMWANVSQLMPMTRLRQVHATTTEAKAFIGDETETREPTFYNRQMLVDFAPEDVIEGYAMRTETRPFGFEFIRNASFREINFGKYGGSDQVLKVAGRELARPGFRLCKECGTVQGRRDKANHLFNCKYYHAADDDGEDNAHDGILDSLYLYREYESEAVQILMPGLSLTENDERKHSFIAALQLGLKTQFGGKVDHLNITVRNEREPVTATQASYVVLYDTVPGGTGYLHTLLAGPQEFVEMLKKSRQVLADCDCQKDPDQDVDGCYNCLFAYRNSYGMENTSRKTALTMLNDILDEGVELERIDNLQTIDKSVWADSELERLFPEALRELSLSKSINGERVRVARDIVNGKVGFKLEVGKQMYSVEPHARLGEEQGVACFCEPDFLISHDRESEEQIQIAVFLDGYSYHKDIIHEDLLKRQGIFLGTRILTWSLTWYDVNAVLTGSEVNIPNALRDNTANAPIEFIQKIGKSKNLQAHDEIANLSPLVMLLRFLSQPDIKTWRSYAMLRALCWVDRDRMKDIKEREIFDEQKSTWPDQYVDDFSDLEPVFFSSNRLVDSKAALSVFVAGGKAAITELDPDAIVLSAVFDPIDTEAELTRVTWQKLLQILNIGQFLPKFFAGTREAIENGAFTRLEWGKKARKIASSEWDKVAKLVDDEVADLIQALANSNAPFPQTGYELVDAKGVGIGEAELAWEDLKTAFMLDYQLERSRKAFEKHGWTIVTFDDDLDVLLNMLRDQG